MNPESTLAGRRSNGVRRLSGLLGILALLGAAAPEPVVATRADPILVESIAFDQGGRLLVGAVHAAGVFRLHRNGRLVRWSRAQGQGVYGIVADPKRGALWAATSGSVYGGDPTASPALVHFDLRSGREVARYPGGAEAKSFGDIALGPDGTVFVSDSGGGEVLKLSPNAAALERVIKLEGRASPQGLVVSDDGGTLVFANYADGLHRIDLTTGGHSRVLNAEGRSPRGIDGVTRRGDDLILVYNGAQPARVLRVTLNADWTAIVDSEVLAEGAPMLEPTGGVVRGEDFIFVSHSQWTDFGEDGKPKPDLAPAQISRLKLPPAKTPSGG